MKCPVCQQEVRDDAHFCTVCGAKMEPIPESQPVYEVSYEPETAVTPEPEMIPESAVQPEPAFIPAPVATAEPESVAAPVVKEEPVPQHKYEYVPQAPVAQPTQQTVYQTVYQQTKNSDRPIYQLPDRRGLLKMIFLGLITCGIYNVVVMSRIAEEINIVASKHDGKRTQQFMWMYVLTCLTLGIYAFVWIHGLCNRIGDEVKRRELNYKFSAADFWIWNFLVSIIGGIVVGIMFIIVATVGSEASAILLIVTYLLAVIAATVGPYIFTYKFCKATNLMNKDYNLNG